MIQNMKVRIGRISSRYWIPIGPSGTVGRICKILKGRVSKRSIVIISEKALLISCGYIYDEKTININTLSRNIVKVYRAFWCNLLKNLLKDFVYESICNVRLDDISRHAILCSRVCKLNILSLLKPVSTCGVDASGLPYYYVTYPCADYRDIINKIYRKLNPRAIIVADSDVSLIVRKLRIVLTSRPVFVRSCINLGVVTYILSRLRSRLFVKCPTMTYIVGDKSLSTYRGFLILRKVERFRKACYGRSVTEMSRLLGSRDYTSVTWLLMSKSGPHYPLITIDYLGE